MRAQEISIMPQMDGLLFLPMRDPIGRRIQDVPRLGRTRIFPREAHMCKKPPCQEGENIHVEMAMMMTIENHIEIRDPLKEGDIQIKVEDLLTEDDTQMEYPLEEDTPIEMEDSLEEEGTQEEDPLMEMENPLMVEDLMVMEDPWTSWWTRTTRSSRTP